MRNAREPSKSAPGARHGTLEEALIRLGQTSLRRTKAREALLEALVRKHGPYTVDELASSLRGRQMDLVTIYRCLSAFEEAGLVRRCEFGDGVSRYEFECEHEHHHHIVCRGCRKTEKLDDCAIRELEERVARRGYSGITHTLEFFGVCRGCRG